jgi:very-short-patch-repair endonuclease
MTAAESLLTSSLSRLRERAGVRAHARNLRNASTDAERLLWHHLRSRHLAGYKFRRQHPLGRFIADSACIEAMLIVELDGGQHFELAAAEVDRQRTSALEQLGFLVLRFDNRQMLLDTEVVLSVIHERLSLRCPHPNPLPQAGEGVIQRN